MIAGRLSATLLMLPLLTITITLSNIATMNNDPTEANGRPRGRPRTRYADRDEQVRQNMRLYRARRAAELEALARALDRLAACVDRGDLEATYRAAAAAVGLWSASALKDNVIKNRKRRKAAAAGGA